MLARNSCINSAPLNLQGYSFIHMLSKVPYAISFFCANIFLVLIYCLTYCCSLDGSMAVGGDVSTRFMMACLAAASLTAVGAEGWLPSRLLPLAALPPAAATAAATAPCAIMWLRVVFERCCGCLWLLQLLSPGSEVGLQTRPPFNDLRNLSLLLLFSVLGIIYHTYSLS